MRTIVSVVDILLHLQGPLTLTFLPVLPTVNTLNMNEVISLDNDKNMFDHQHSKSLSLAANIKNNRCMYL